MATRGSALWWAIGVAVTAGVAVAVSGQGFDVLWGVAAPSVVAGVSWVAMTRAWRRSPGALWPLMLKAFPLKALVFGGYVAVMLGVLEARAVPFVGSFGAAFLATHLTEAYCLRRLIAPTLDAGSPSRQ